MKDLIDLPEPEVFEDGVVAVRSTHHDGDYKWMISNGTLYTSSAEGKLRSGPWQKVHRVSFTPDRIILLANLALVWRRANCNHEEIVAEATNGFTNVTEIASLIDQQSWCKACSTPHENTLFDSDSQRSQQVEHEQRHPKFEPARLQRQEKAMGASRKRDLCGPAEESSEVRAGTDADSEELQSVDSGGGRGEQDAGASDEPKARAYFDSYVEKAKQKRRVVFEDGSLQHYDAGGYILHSLYFSSGEPRYRFVGKGISKPMDGIEAIETFDEETGLDIFSKLSEL